MPAPERRRRRGKPAPGRGGSSASVAAGLVLAAGLVAAFETKVFTPSHPTPTLVEPAAGPGPGRRGQGSTCTLQQGAAGQVDHGAPPATIVSQSPKPGVSLKEGSTVTVVLSNGPPDVTVPSLTA